MSRWSPLSPYSLKTRTGSHDTTESHLTRDRPVQSETDFSPSLMVNDSRGQDRVRDTNRGVCEIGLDPPPPPPRRITNVYSLTLSLFTSLDNHRVRYSPFDPILSCHADVSGPRIDDPRRKGGGIRGSLRDFQGIPSVEWDRRTSDAPFFTHLTVFFRNDRGSDPCGTPDPGSHLIFSNSLSGPWSTSVRDPKRSSEGRFPLLSPEVQGSLS